MFCNKCGDSIEHNEVYCNKCGNYLGKAPTNNKKNIFIGIGIGVLSLLIIFGVIGIVEKLNPKVYLPNNPTNDDPIINTPPIIKNKYSTVIVTDNTLVGVKVNSVVDAYKLISFDSVSQKNKCPSEIKKIEDRIIKDYSITAVNLCELDVNFSRELEKVLKKIYAEYPFIKGYMTNITLINNLMSDDYIAAFMPMFHFATADTSSSYPWVFKMQILLSAKYYLNQDRLKITINNSVAEKHFPQNATIYSPLAHEFGHYLSFIALINSYNEKSVLLMDNYNNDSMNSIYSKFIDGSFSLKLITEAYNNYKRDKNDNILFDDWRATISKYSVAKNNSGNYIYDETIAEAFHDVYLNENNAQEASKYIVKVLEKYLEG